MYTAPMKPTLVIVGLGNPGAAYAATRHNAGFRALDVLQEQFGEGGEWKTRPKLLITAAEAAIGEVQVLLAKPQTFMNRSGEAVSKIVQFFKLDPSYQLLVLSDDCDLPLGEVRLRRSGGPGTHNGLKSVVEQVGEGFPRLRIGLGSPSDGVDLAQWVLSVPVEADRRLLEETIRGEVPKRVREFVLGKV